MLRPLMIASLALTTACGPSALKRAQPMIANPASVNCTTRGGQLVIRQTRDGQKGYCLLQDGRSLDIWEYFRQTNG